MTLGRELAAFVAPLPAALATPDGAAGLLRDLGLLSGAIGVESVPGEIVALGTTAADVLERLTDLRGDEIGLVQTLEALAAIVGLAQAIQDVAELASSALDERPIPFDAPGTWTGIASGLPGLLLARWLRDFHPVGHALLEVGGVVVENETGAGVRVDFDAFGELMADPAGRMRSLVASDPAVLLPPLQTIAAAAGTTRRSRPIRADGQRAYADEEVERPHPPRLDLSILTVEPGESWAIDVALDPVTAGGDPGLRVLATAFGAPGATARLSPTWALEVALVAEGAAGFVLTGDGVRIADGAVATEASLRLVGTPPAPWLLFGSPAGTRLELAGIAFGVEGERLLATPEVVLDAELDGLRLVVSPGDGDSFIAHVLGGVEVDAEATLAFSWSSVDGVRLGLTEGALDLTIPIERSLGPLTVHAVRIALAGAASGLTIELGTFIGLAIGPIGVVVDDIGLRGSFVPASQPGCGAFGDVDLTMGFKPPTGLGLTVDAAGIVTGGGYLSFDPEAGRYAGAAELQFATTGLVAVGVLITDLPDGDGWSLFLSLGARFVGIQLGFGFTLNGVGGLVGINRCLDAEALGDAVRSGSLDAILFPEDPVAQCTQILADIDAIFPPMSGQYVFGPVVEIGWGTPTLIDIDLGIAIQLPEPLTISLLGTLAAVLPADDLPILELHAAVAGTIDITAGTLAIDASLSGSHVAGLLLTGDMSVRAGFLDDPTFLVAFGGFHPDFDPPASFPTLERVGVALDGGDDLRMSLGGYFALTSNTIQFGAAAELYAQAVGFSVEGSTRFDTLITFKPFGFDIALSASVCVSAGSAELLAVDLSGSLTGPDPWHAVCRASFKLLGLEQHLDVEVTIGEDTGDAALESVDIVALLEEALDRDDAWSALEPEGGASVVVAAVAGEEGLVVHPSGRVQVAQRIVPLDCAIERYGAQRLADSESYALTAVDFDADDVESVDDWFATAQYFDLGEDEKLSAPSFTSLPAGLSVGASGSDHPASADLTYDHEIEYRDPDGRTGARASKQPVLAQADTMTRGLAGRAAAPTQRYTISETTYVVIDGATGELAAEVTPGGIGFVAARTALGSADDALLTLAPEHELAALA